MTKRRLSTAYTAAVILFLGLSSCGKFDRIDNGGFTNVTFASARNEHYLTSSTLTNGIIITAYSDTYATNMKLSDETSAASITLPNGTYSFFGFGYGYSIDSNGSEIRCAVKDGANAVVLNGTAQTVSLDFTQLNCSNTAFRPNASYMDQFTNTSGTAPNKGPVFSKLDFVFCSSAAGTGLAGITASQDCGTSAGISQPFTNITNYQVVFPLFKRIAGVSTRIGEAFRSTCANSYPVTSGTVAMSQEIRYPAGNSQLPGAFPFEIEAYSEAACTSSPVISRTFKEGLYYGDSSGAIYGTALPNTSGTNRLRVFLRQQ